MLDGNFYNGTQFEVSLPWVIQDCIASSLVIRPSLISPIFSIYFVFYEGKLLHLYSMTHCTKL
jgi:hypothetical protein